MSDDDSQDTDSQRSLNRRTMLSALGIGAGATFALGRWGESGRSVLAGGGRASPLSVQETCEPCIDLYSGWLQVQPVMERPDVGAGTETPGNATAVIGNETATPGNETATPINETVTPGNETDTPINGTATPGNETGTPGAETPAPEVPFEPVLTVEARVTDADVVFVEEDGEEGTPEGTPEETPEGTPEETPEDGDQGEGEEPGEGEGPGEGPIGPDGPIPDFYFDPVGFRLRPGDVVAFENVDELHTVTAYHPRIFGNQRRVPEGVVGFSSPPMFPGDTWYYRFDEPGIYDLHCLPHEQLGMVARAIVLEEDAEVPSAYEDAPEDQPGPSEIAQRVFNAPELEPQNVVDQEEVAWTDLTGVESEPPF